MGLLSDSGTQLLSRPCPWPQLWKYPLSPPPSLMLGWFPPSYFSIPRRAWGGCTLGSRPEEGGSSRSDRQADTLFQAVGGGDLLLPRQPAHGRGLWKSCPILPPQPPVLRGSRPRSVPSDHKWGFVFPRQRTHSSPPTWARACLPCPNLGLGRDGATSQEGKLRSRDRSVEPEEGSASGLGVEVEQRGGKLAVTKLPS